MITKLKSAAPAIALATMAALTLLSAIDSASACKGKHDKGGEKPGKVHSQGMPKPPASSKPGKRTIVSKADIIDQPEPR